MFSKGKAPEAPTSMASPIPSAPAAPVKKPGGRSAPSIISADLLVQGSLVSQRFDLGRNQFNIVIAQAELQLFGALFDRIPTREPVGDMNVAGEAKIGRV